MVERAALLPFVSNLRFKVLLRREMELPVSRSARTLLPFMVMTLHGQDSGFGEVKQHDITVQKLIMAAGRETEQVLIPLVSFPSLLPQIHIPQRILPPALLLLLELRIVDVALLC